MSGKAQTRQKTLVTMPIAVRDDETVCESRRVRQCLFILPALSAVRDDERACEMKRVSYLTGWRRAVVRDLSKEIRYSGAFGIEACQGGNILLTLSFSHALSFL